MFRSLAHHTAILSFLFISALTSEVYGVGHPTTIKSNESYAHSWVDPAPVPTDPTDPRGPTPPLPLPYPEPPHPLPIPSTPSVTELLQIIKDLEQEIKTLRLKIQTLETRLHQTHSNKKKPVNNCEIFLQKLSKAIMKQAQIDNSPEILSKKIDRVFLSKLFRSGLLDYIPTFHKEIKGSLDTKLYCEK